MARMFLIAPFIINACILWFLLVLFAEDSNYESQQQSAITITLVVTFVGLLIKLAVGYCLPPGFGFLTPLGNALVLYIAVERFCGYSSRTTLKIVVSFFGVQLIWGMIAASLF